MGIFTYRGYLKKIRLKLFVQIFKDYLSNYPEQNGIQKLGDHRPYKINIVSMARPRIFNMSLS
jgi:hypothetical protein